MSELENEHVAKIRQLHADAVGDRQEAFKAIRRYLLALPPGTRGIEDCYRVAADLLDLPPERVTADVLPFVRPSSLNAREVAGNIDAVARFLLDLVLNEDVEVRHRLEAYRLIAKAARLDETIASWREDADDKADGGVP